MMTRASATALSGWLLANQPGIFATALKHHAKTTGQKLSGLGDDDDLVPVDVTAQYINDPAYYAPDIEPNLITPDMPNLVPNVNIPANLNIDTSAANITTPALVASQGSSLGDAIGNVATFLLKGVAAVVPVAAAALNAQAASDNKSAQFAVVAAQTARANAGLAPANIAYTANGTPVYIPTAGTAGGLTTMPAGLGAAVTLPNGQTGYTLTPQALTNLQPSFLQQYGIWIFGGGLLLAAFALLN